MRALVMKGTWRLELEELPPPEPAAGEALLEIVATGICGSDIHGFTGENGRRFPGQVMGHETVARVAALGPQAGGGRLGEGQLVTVNPVISCGECASCRADAQQRCPTRRVIGVDPTLRSAFAEMMTAPVGNVVPLPDGVPLEHGALIEPLAVGYHAARRGRCAPGDRVFVIGGGPIGQAAALGARRLGVDSVVVSEPDAGRRSLLDRLGLATVDPTPDGSSGGDGEPREAELAARVSAALGGSPTCVLDAVGASGTASEALTVAELDARVVLVGMHTPRLDLPAYAISTAERSLIGSFCYSATEFTDTAQWAASADCDLSSLVEGRVDLAAAAQSFTSLAKGENPASKVLVYSRSVPGTDLPRPTSATPATPESR